MLVEASVATDVVAVALVMMVAGELGLDILTSRLTKNVKKSDRGVGEMEVVQRFSE